MDQLINQAEELIRAIKREAGEIDNPVLTVHIVSELENFVYTLKQDDY